MGLLDEARAKNREESRTRGEQRGPRNAQEAKPKDTYYRPEYGWIMSNDMVKKEQEVKGQYDAQTESVRNQIATADKGFQDSINNGVNDISSQYDNAIKGIQKQTLELVPIRVVNGNNIEGVYYLPRDTINNMDANSFNKGTGSYYGNWVDGGSNYNVDVRVKGGGARGQEIHDALRGASDQVSQTQRDYEDAYNQAVRNAEEEKSNAISGFQSTSADTLDKQREVWNQELQNTAGLYDNRIATGAQQYETSKKNYNDSVMNMNAGLLENPTSQVVTGGVVQGGTAQGATDQVLKEVK